ncbi:MAG: type II toxin-antitoxin system RelE/ParE family toxin [Candidatus Contendobacter sp.]
MLIIAFPAIKKPRRSGACSFELTSFRRRCLHHTAHTAHGLERAREPYVKHLQGRLWEMRLKGKDGIARAVYVTAIGYRVVVVRVFSKKTQKTPRKEIELALQRAKEVT